MHWDLVVVGAGAAGLLGAARAAECGCKTLLIEKNRKPGVKILMSGGTRCNLTHHTDRRGIIEAFGSQGRFLHSALAALGPQELVQLVESEGVATKVEDTGKVFPVSNKATDVLQAFLQILHRSGAQLSLGEALIEFEPQSDGFRLVTSQQTILASRLLITTGGQSYPGCGTTGDGYRWAETLGHTIVRPRAALTPLTTSANWVRQLSGLTLPDVGVQLVERARATIMSALPAGEVGEEDPQGPPSRERPSSRSTDRRVLDQRRGSFLFTHFGLSGPAPLDISRFVTGHPRPDQLDLVCDFLPERKLEQADQQLQQQCLASGKRQIATLLEEFLPARLAEALFALAGLNGQGKAAELSKKDRRVLVDQMKGTPIPLTGAKGFEKAEVTAGGVSLDEVDSKTLQSKRQSNLYFAGEVLDLDGPIGGYNFQAAFSTGFLAGQSAAWG